MLCEIGSLVLSNAVSACVFSSESTLIRLILAEYEIKFYFPGGVLRFY